MNGGLLGICSPVFLYGGCFCCVDSSMHLLSLSFALKQLILILVSFMFPNGEKIYDVDFHCDCVPLNSLSIVLQLYFILQ